MEMTPGQIMEVSGVSCNIPATSSNPPTSELKIRGAVAQKIRGPEDSKCKTLQMRSTGPAHFIFRLIV
jgi:hypothetical protein